MAKHKNTVEKGYELEKEFAEFMKSDLGYSKYHIHHNVSGLLNKKGTAVDVIAEKPDQKGIKYKELSHRYYIFSCCFIIAGCFMLICSFIAIGIFTFALGVVGLIITLFVMIHSDKFNVEHGWVECKNLSGKVNINQIEKVLREFRDFSATQDNELKVTRVYFVSKSGFIDNALKFAQFNNVICYQKEPNGKFVIVKYWE